MGNVILLNMLIILLNMLIFLEDVTPRSTYD